jgi:Putative transposase
VETRLIAIAPKFQRSHSAGNPHRAVAVASRQRRNRASLANPQVANENCVTFKVKDYRIEGAGRYKTMTLDVAEFIRRFLIHVLPNGFRRIRHYELFANGSRAETLAARSRATGRHRPERRDRRTSSGQFPGIEHTGPTGNQRQGSVRTRL